MSTSGAAHSCMSRLTRWSRRRPIPYTIPPGASKPRRYKEADLRDCELEKKYHDTIGADANALVVGQKREAEAETPAASDQGPPKKRRKCYQ